MAADVRLKVCGAARTVTGSRYLVEAHGRSLLVDCGLFQGKKELRMRNWEAPPFDPAALEAVVLTHAHIDHTGYLPLLVRRGFRGPIYCTEATSLLVRLLLPDSAHLQEEEAKYANEHGSSKHQPAKPLYDMRDVDRTLKLLRPFPFHTPTEVVPGVRFSATPGGHILGAAILSMDAGTRRITFSGDVGRYGVPLLVDPQPVEFGDLLLCESTYGNRVHDPQDKTVMIEGVIQRALERGGPVIVPAFALGRTQELLYHLAVLESKGAIPELPVFVDSPMASDATAIYGAHRDELDDEARAHYGAGEKPLSTKRTTFCQTVQESKRINDMSGTFVVISASGMVNGGRILHHMLRWLPRPEATVLFVGYQAEDTRGQIIQSGAPDVKIFGQRVPIRAHIETISGLSAHADKLELERWLASCSGSPSVVRIVHGESDAATEFASFVSTRFGWKAQAAEQLEVIEL